MKSSKNVDFILKIGTFGFADYKFKLEKEVLLGTKNEKNHKCRFFRVVGL